MKIGFISLGCPKNQLDTEVMLHEVMSAGHEITPEETEADIVIINTCAFIESAKKEAIDNILDIAWLKKHANLKGIIVTGCMAERYGEEILKEFPEVDAVLGVGSIHKICDAVNSVVEHINSKKKVNKNRYFACDDKNAVELGGDRILTTPEYAAYLKISEGCDNRCTYCAIPNIRGKFRSRPMEELIEEARELDSLGVRELTIIAQDTTKYGIDLYGEYSLHKLIQNICKETSIPWIRLLYCYPDKITDELIAEIRDNPRVVKYIDIPLQHISDPILKHMNRRGNSDLIKSVIKKLRDNIKDIAIRTTFIVGFPGETEEDFTRLAEFIKEARFEHAGVFTYSREEDTPAYNFDNQIDEQVKQDRMDILMKSQLEINYEQNEAKIGTTMRVLCEDYDPVSEMHFGRSQYDAPEIDGKIFFKSEERIAPGSFVDVKIRKVMDYDLCGFAVTNSNKGE